MKILLTGVAGFIGAAVCKRLIEAQHFVVGIDNLNAYYDPMLKQDRLAHIGSTLNFRCIDIADTEAIADLMRSEKFDIVINLAAQAGVRYSLENPYAYINSNIVGFLNIIEGCRQNGVKHLIYASSSSIYGQSAEVPFCENQQTDKPVSLYAATKKSNELIAYSYHHICGLNVTGLRFFTVYGPWGRPDMAPFLFANAILTGNPIKVFNGGNLQRDFTYIDDVVEAVMRITESPGNGYRIYNIGNSSPVNLNEFISEVERATKLTAIKELLPMQPGDVTQTFADTSAFEQDYGFKPSTPLHRGIEETINWFKSYYKYK